MHERQLISEWTPQQRKISIYIALLCSVFSTTMLSLSHPLVNVLLAKQGVSIEQIALLSTVYGFASFILWPFLSSLLKKFGVAVVVGFSMLMTLICFLASIFATEMWHWYIIRCGYGVAVMLQWIGVELWVNVAADESNRARAISSYVMTCTIGFLGGLGLLALLGYGATAYWFCCGLSVIAFLAILLGHRFMPSAADMQAQSAKDESGQAHKGLGMKVYRSLFLRAKILFIIALFAGAVEMFMKHLIPVYWEGLGLSDAMVTNYLIVCAVGGTIIVAGAGWATERFNRRWLLPCLIALFVASCSAIPFAETVIERGLAMFFLGGSVLSLYSVTLTFVGSRFEGEELVEANSLFIMIFLLGSVVGPVLFSQLGGVFAEHGLIYSAIAFGGVIFLIELYRALKLTAKGVVQGEAK